MRTALPIGKPLIASCQAGRHACAVACETLATTNSVSHLRHRMNGGLSESEPANVTTRRLARAVATAMELERTMKRALWLGGALLATLWLLSARAPVDAQAWQPPPNPGLTGAFAPNQALAAIAEISVGMAPEHVACGADGTLYTSLDGGAVLRGSSQRASGMSSATQGADHWGCAPMARAGCGLRIP